MRCTFYIAAEFYNLKDIEHFYQGKANYTTYPDVFCIYAENYNVFIFSYGSVVFWNMSSIIQTQYLDEMKAFTSSALTKMESDYCEYNYGDAFEVSEKRDTMTLNSNDMHIKLACSYAFSQSMKLLAFENRVRDTIQNTRLLTNELMASGKISLSAVDLSKKMGALFALKYSIIIHSAILDEPEYLWHQPKYRTYYEAIRGFMAIKQRLTLLDNRLGVINDLYRLLSDELKHRYLARLELITLWLIAIEVVLGIFGR